MKGMDIIMRIMAVDYGDARTGIAVSDFSGILASGVETIFEKRPFVPPLIASIYFAIIILLNAHWGTPSFDFYYKDISIALASLALAIKSRTL